MNWSSIQTDLPERQALWISQAGPGQIFFCRKVCPDFVKVIAETWYSKKLWNWKSLIQDQDAGESQERNFDRRPFHYSAEVDRVIEASRCSDIEEGAALAKRGNFFAIRSCPATCEDPAIQRAEPN